MRNHCLNIMFYNTVFLLLEVYTNNKITTFIVWNPKSFHFFKLILLRYQIYNL